MSACRGRQMGVRMNRLDEVKTDIVRVAIVEDEPPMLRFLHKLLSGMEGFSIAAECRNAEEMLEAINEKKVDLLISDIRMPGMDGLKLAEKYRSMSADMHIVIVTGYRSFEYAKTAIDLNIDAFITKPIDQEEFRKVLSRIRESFLEKYFEEMRSRLEKAFQYNEEQQYERILSGGGSIYNSICIVYYPGDLQELLEAIKHIRKKCLYTCYKRAVIFFGRGTEGEEIFRYVSVKLDSGLRKQNTAACVRIAPLDECAPSIAQLKEFCRKQLLQIVVPGSFLTCTLEDFGQIPQKNASYQRDEGLYRETELSVLSRKWDTIWQQINALFALWKKDQVPFAHLRRRVHDIVSLCDKSGILETDATSLKDQIDETMVCFDSYEEMEEYFVTILKENTDMGASGFARKDRELFDRIKELVLKNLEHNYSLQEVCAIFQVSQPYVRKIFMTHTGKTYNDFILGEKIKYAVWMINANPGIQVKELAAMLGYEQLYFGTIFKKSTGLTPSQYKQKTADGEKKHENTVIE